MINELPDNKYADVLGPSLHIKIALQPEVVYHSCGILLVFGCSGNNT